MILPTLNLTFFIKIGNEQKIKHQSKYSFGKFLLLEFHGRRMFDGFTLSHWFGARFYVFLLTPAPSFMLNTDHMKFTALSEVYQNSRGGCQAVVS